MFRNKKQPNRQHHFRTRYIIITCLIIVFILTLIGRIFYLSVIDHQHYKTKSQRNFLNIVPVAPTRGIIVDRNNVVLAKNTPAYRLSVIPAKTNNLQDTLKKLQHIAPIENNDITQFNKHLYQHHSYDSILIGDNLNETQRDVFYTNAFKFPGVSIQSIKTRSYPLGKYSSSVVGYVGKINSKDSIPNASNYLNTSYIGKSGIEKSQESLLHGQTGFEEAEINANGKIVRTLKNQSSTPGSDLKLTIDIKLQQYIIETLGDLSAAVVAIDPNNGDILAMASTPTYDSNLFSKGMSTLEYQELLDNPNNPLYNKTTRGLYSPGSTIKPFFAVSALDNNIVNATDKIYDPGWFQLPNSNHKFHDWMWFIHKKGHGWIDLPQALVVSCDTYFYQMADKMGIDLMDHTLKTFGFGNKTGIEMPNEANGTIPTPAWKLKNRQASWYSGDTVITGIGQGSLLVTPLQLAMATATLAMKGKQYQPHLIQSNNTPQGVNKTNITPKSTIHLNNKDNWEIINTALQKVITDPLGTAIYFGHPKYSVAAKTGTAQVYGHHRDEEYTQSNIPLKLRNNHLFIDYAPANNPKIAIAIVIEHAGGADNIARKITDYYLKKIKI